MLLQQSEGTAAQRRWFFVCVDDTDGKTPETGLTFSGAELQLSKNGAAFASFAGTATELTDGLYYYEATAGELDTLGALAFKVEKTGVRLVQMQAAQVVPWDPYDSVRLGQTALPNANAEAAGGLYTRGSGAGQINQPANGRVDANVVAMAADVVTAAAVADGAIDAGALATGAITSAKFAAGAIDATAIGTNAITATKIGANAITASAIATDAITAAKIATDAVTEIQAGLATSTALATVAGYVDTEVAALVTAVAAVQTDVDDIQARLPAALVSGRMDASVGAMAANVMTAAAAAADLATELQAGLATEANVDSIEAAILAAVATVQADTDNIQTRLPAALVSGRIDASVGAMAANTVTAAAVAADAVTELQSGLATSTALMALDDVVDAGLAATATAIDALPTTAELATALSPLATSAEVSALDTVVDAIGAALSAAVAAVQADTDALQTGQAAVATVADRIEVDTQDIQGRIPAALVGGRIDSSVGAMAANVVTAAAAAADLGTELAAAIAGSLSIPTAAQVRDAILDYSHGTGVIVRGLLERLETLAAGRWTGLRGATATGYARDGVTPVVEMEQNVPLGTREQWPGSDV